MLPVAVVFVVVLVVVFGSFYVTVLRPEDDTRESIRKRLASGATLLRKRRATSFLKSEDDVTAFPVLDRLLKPWQSFSVPLARTLQEADQKMTVGALLFVCALSAVVVYALVYVVFGSQWVALPAGALAARLPISAVKFMAGKRMRTFEEQFPDAIDLISRALRAGHGFTTALAMAADEGPQPVAAEFKKLYDEQNFGMPLPEAMREFAARIPILDAKFFVTAVLTQRESGGNLAEVLDNLGRVVRERFKVKRQIRVISAHGRMTGGVLMGLPPFLAAAFMLINPQHLKVLTTDVLGWWLIGGALTLQIVGCLIIRKLINIEY